MPAFHLLCVTTGETSANLFLVRIPVPPVTQRVAVHTAAHRTSAARLWRRELISELVWCDQIGVVSSSWARAAAYGAPSPLPPGKLSSPRACPTTLGTLLAAPSGGRFQLVFCAGVMTAWPGPRPAPDCKICITDIEHGNVVRTLGEHDQAPVK